MVAGRASHTGRVDARRQEVKDGRREAAWTVVRAPLAGAGNGPVCGRFLSSSLQAAARRLQHTEMETPRPARPEGSARSMNSARTQQGSGPA